MIHGIIPLTLSGCALHYYDQKSGVEHLWGIGHMKMAVQPPSEGVQAVVQATQTFGVGVGFGAADYTILAGWNNHRSLRVADNTAVRIEWPEGSFFNVRVGTNIPPRPGIDQQQLPNAKP